MARKGIDREILGRMAGGIALAAVPIVVLLITDRPYFGLAGLGACGVALFLWGLFSIGDQKNEWE